MKTIPEILDDMSRVEALWRKCRSASIYSSYLAARIDQLRAAHEADKKKLIEAQQVAEDALCKLADKEVAVSKTETPTTCKESLQVQVAKQDLTTETVTDCNQLNMAKCREALEKIADALTKIHDCGGVVRALAEINEKFAALMNALKDHCYVGDVHVADYTK